MKKNFMNLLVIVLTIAVLAGVWIPLAGAAEDGGITAVPTGNRVFVDGKEMAPAAYKIAGSNYFRLRDLAYMLNGTPKQFGCDYDEDTRTVVLTSGKAYSPVGSEMAVPRPGNVSVKPSTMKVVKDGEEICLAGYLIRGSNYFKLRDIMALFDAEVQYDEAASAVKIETTPAPGETTVNADRFDDWSAPLNTTSDKWQKIVAESGEVREIPFHIKVTAYAPEGSKPAAGCEVLLYFMDKATGQPDCLIGAYRTGADGYVHTTLTLPWKYIEDSRGRDCLTPSWFGYRLQDTMEIDGKTFYGKFIVCDWSFLQLNDFYPLSMTEAEILQMVCEESMYRNLEETVANRSKS